LSVLDKSWSRAWSGLGLPGNGEEVRQRLLAAWSEPHRKYHTLQHLSECAAALEPVRAATPHAAEIEFALWFHDAIYDVKRSDNEARSADWAGAELGKAGAPIEAIELVRDLVMITKHDTLPQSLEEQVLLDVDLSILGADEQRFAEFENQVRQEYSFVPGFLFRMKRRSILRTFLAREHIYSTPHFRERLEEAARRNLALAVS
jgi:predicted metal-dependent HD superfamily phosphohydrolase